MIYELMTEKPYITREFKSSTSDKYYKTALYDYDSYCTCPWFRNRHKCKHVTTLFKHYKNSFEKN